ncbi:hypothetical protein Psyaliredsea_17430 [Psychrobacter alimentarius]
MQILLILIVVLGGMGLSVEAGLLGPLGGQVGELWATLSIFGVGAALTFFLCYFLVHAIALHFSRNPLCYSLAEF